MRVVTSRTFMSGNSVALRLPRGLAIGPDIEMEIEQAGNVLTIRPAVDPDAEKRALADMIAALRALPKPSYIERREPPEPPERPGL